MLDIGYYSLPVVGLTAIFTGMVLALQSYTGFSRFNAESAIPTIVVLSIDPRARPGAGRPDGGRPRRRRDGGRDRHHARDRADRRADHALDRSRCSTWSSPRLLAGLLMLPLLVLVADVIGVLGGYLVSVYKLGFNAGRLHQPTPSTSSRPIDVVSGLVKAAVFGFIVALMGCYHGYHSQGGAQGVGAATTNAVVSASILILTANYILTELFFSR